MNKKELITQMTKATDIKLTQKQAEAALNAFMETVQEILKQGDSIQLVGFGKFFVKQSAEKRVVNPKTKEPMMIASRMVPKFKFGKNNKQG